MKLSAPKRRRSASATFLLLAGASTAMAKPFWLRGSDSNEQDFLPPDVAFRVAAHVDGQRLNLRWIIADGYYIYRDKIEAEAASPGLALGRPILPPGVTLTDEYFGSQQVYFTEVVVSVPLQRSDYGAHPAEIKITYQGCAKAGLCYPPMAKVLYPGPEPTVQGEATVSPHMASMGRRGYASWQTMAIVGGLAAFVLAGLLLRKNRGLPMPPA